MLITNQDGLSNMSGGVDNKRALHNAMERKRRDSIKVEFIISHLWLINADLLFLYLPYKIILMFPLFYFTILIFLRY